MNTGSVQARQPPVPGIPCHRGERLRRLRSDLTAAEALNQFMVLAIDLFSVLALVTEQGCPLLAARGRDVHIDLRHKAECLIARVHFEEVEEERTRGGQIS